MTTALDPWPAEIDPAPLELIDSSPLLRGPDDRRRATLLDRFRTHGYLLFRGQVPADEVQDVRDRITEVLEAHGVVDGDGSLRTRPDVPVIASPRYLAMLRDVVALEAMHRLAYTRCVTAVIRHLVDEEVIVHPRKVARFCHPHRLDPGSTTGVHQDHTYVQGGADGITAWVPITDAPRRRGALAVLEGSAAEGVRWVAPTDGPCGSGPSLLDAADAGRWGSTDFAAGDLLLMHGFTVHRALPNRTDRTRLSLDLRYRGVSQELTLPEMWPPHHPCLGEWSELVNGWASTAWLDLPAGVRIIGARPARSGLDVPASELMGTPAATLPPL